MSTTMDSIRELQPDAVAELDRLNQTASVSTDAELLELCVARVTEMLWGEKAAEPAASTAEERAYLEFTEQFVTSVSTVSDEQVEALLAYSSAQAVYAFIEALYVREMTLRIERVAEEVLR